jgi:hypothetical protein
VFEELRCAADALLTLRRGVAHLRLTFPEYVVRVKESHKISALLRRAGVGIETNDSFRFSDVSFTLAGRELVDDEDYYDDDENERTKEITVLDFVLAGDKVGSTPFDAAELLWQRGVLRMK